MNLLSFFYGVQGMNLTLDKYEPIHKNVNCKIHPESHLTTPGTLLIPEAYSALMIERMQKLNMRSFSIYFRYLISEYKVSVLSSRFPVSQNIKKKYQTNGLSLRRVSIRSSNEDWLILSELSHGTGLSRCFVFVLLFEMDIGLLGNIDVVPTPRSNKSGKILKYAVIFSQIVYPMSNYYQRRIRIYELSRLRDPLIREYPEYYEKDGSYKIKMSKIFV